MSDFFFYTAPEEQNTVRIFNVAFSRDERGSACPDDETSDAVIKILWLGRTVWRVADNLEKTLLCKFLFSWAKFFNLDTYICWFSCEI